MNGKYSVKEYQEITRQTGLYPEGGTGSLIAITYCALGLGEAGEVQGKLKKVWRGDAGEDYDARVRAWAERTAILLSEEGDRRGGFDAFDDPVAVDIIASQFRAFNHEPTLEQREAMLDECGDTLWYLTRMAEELGSSLQGLIDRNGTKVTMRKIAGTIKGDGDKR
jgi:hypothetical protein